MPTEVEMLTRLDRQIARAAPRIRRYDAYLEGEQPLRFMAPELVQEIGDRVTQLVINWPRMCVDAYEHRLDIVGFRRPTDTDNDRDDDLWQLFTDLDGVALYQQAHVELIACGRVYAFVGSPEDDGDPPVLTIEHPLQVAVRHDPRTRQIVEGAKRWKDEDGVQWANLYLPDSTVRFRRAGRDWSEDSRDDHGAGRLLITEFLNRGRLLRKDGVSEFHDVIPIADAANKMATDMMISGEFHAIPRRWATGMSKADFVDEKGDPMSVWSQVAGRIWATANAEAKYGQFPETDLAVFHRTIQVLAQLAGQLMYLPQDYMSFTSDNPTSAEGMRASESRLVKRAERMQTNAGSGWKKVMRDLRFIERNGEDDEGLRSLEVLWRNAATPTVAQVADASVKLVQEGIIDVEQAREDIGYTPGTQERMRKRDEARRDKDLAAGVAQLFRQEPLPLGQGAGGNAA